MSITEIKKLLSHRGFVAQPDGKTYRHGNEKIYWCSTGCNTNFTYSIEGKQKYSTNGKSYASIYNFLSRERLN